MRENVHLEAPNLVEYLQKYRLPMDSVQPLPGADRPVPTIAVRNKLGARLSPTFLLRRFQVSDTTATPALH